MSKRIEVSCTKCGHMLFFAAKHAGRKGECPYCGEHFIIPESEVELKPVASFMEVSQSSQTIQENPKGYVYMMTTPEEYRNFAWRRWTARLIDFWLGLWLVLALFYGLSFFNGITQIGLGFWTWMIAAPEHLILGIVLGIVLTSATAFFSDALVFSIFETTLGKKICGISVCDLSGNRISRAGYFMRDLNVLFRGNCLLIPLLSTIAHIVQYKRVEKGAASSYDEGCVFQARPTRGKKYYDLFLVIFVNYIYIVNFVRAINRL